MQAPAFADDFAQASEIPEAKEISIEAHLAIRRDEG
jgi:hypothetical protein